MKKLMLFIIFVATLSAAQNSPIPTQPFSFTASAISLPGIKGTFVGTDIGATFSPTQNFSISDHNILSSDGRVDYYGAGPDYALPVISLKANNSMPNLSGFRFLFSVGGSLGVVRVKDDMAVTHQHYGADFHGAFSYALNSTAAWQLGIRAGANRFPGYTRGWQPFVEFGPSFHF